MKILPWTVHRENGDIVASTAYASDAAAVVKRLPKGCTVRYEGQTQWVQGVDRADEPHKVMLARHYGTVAV